MNIYQRLNKVRAQVAYLQKDKKVEAGGSYMVVTHDAVTGAVRGPFIEHGIMVVPFLISSQMIDSGTKTAKGLPIFRYEARYRISFVNIDDPQDKVEIEIESHALDQGDKAPGKATSYATKYAMLKLLSIETGEEEEGRITQIEAKREDPNIRPGAGAWDSLTADRKEEVARKIAIVRDYMEADDQWGAYQEWSSLKDSRWFESPEEEIAAWQLLPSKWRTSINAMRKAEAKKQAELDSKKGKTDGV